MNQFEYSDREMSPREILFTIASSIIGVGILTMPRMVAKATHTSDGWISILIAGLLAILFATICTKLAARFPNTTFTDYASRIATKPVAWVFTIYLMIYYVLFTGFVVRALASIGKLYLFDKTPVEVIALAFLLVVVYAVSGHRIAIARLSVLFLPIVLFISGILVLFSTAFVNHDNYFPMMVTDWNELLKGSNESIFSLLGFEIILVYAAYLNQPSQATKSVIIGSAIPVVLYITIYLVCVGTFSIDVVRQSSYPTIDLAKEVKFPGEFFERFESLFFVIWIMTVFNTAAITYDVAIFSLQSLFPSIKKRIWIRLLTPIIFLIAMTPKSVLQLDQFGRVVGYIGTAFVVVVPATLLIVSSIRGVKNHAGQKR